MKITLTQSEKDISRSDIAEFETKRGLVLPENYKQLILKHNGGVSYEHKYLFELISLKYGEYTLEEFYNALKVVEDNIPTGFFPFAVTATGGSITLNLANGIDYGKVFVFYSDREEGKKIADSLEELFGVKDMDEL